MARVAVIGAGVVGVASAFLLCREDHEVIIVDRNPGPAEGTSRANGAQLSYAYGDALASPSLLHHMPDILFGRDPSYRFRLQTDPEFLIWGLRFLVNSYSGKFLANTRYLLEMAAQTRLLLQDLLAEFDLSFDYTVSGKMILYPTVGGYDRDAKVRLMKESIGIRQDVLDRDQATMIEPALSLYPDTISRVVYSPEDAAGEPDVFCVKLIDKLKAGYGLQTIFGHEVLGIRSNKAQVTGLSFRSREPLDCDWVVAASGYSTGFLPLRDRPYATVWPVQGYSMTTKATKAAMRVSITDLKRKLVFARLGDEVRIAGLADVGVRRFQFLDDRFETFKAASIKAFGDAFEHGDDHDLRGWSEGRPCTPSSRPVIRQCRLAGLYLNLGHGTLGWTLCLGSAKQLMGVIRRARYRR